MMISLFFPFIFFEAPPDHLRVFFLTPPQELLIYQRKISQPLPPPAHKYNMSNSPLAISKSCDRDIELY